MTEQPETPEASLARMAQRSADISARGCWQCGQPTDGTRWQCDACTQAARRWKGGE